MITDIPQKIRQGEQRFDRYPNAEAQTAASPNTPCVEDGKLLMEKIAKRTHEPFWHIQYLDIRALAWGILSCAEQLRIGGTRPSNFAKRSHALGALEEKEGEQAILPNEPIPVPASRIPNLRLAADGATDGTEPHR